MLHVPLTDPEQVVPHLAKGAAHWREGYSAHALATTWFEASGDFPLKVRAVLDASPVFREARLLDAHFERATDLRDGMRGPSQTDLLAFVRTPRELCVVAVEAKVEESFGPRIGNQSGLTEGQQRRLAGLARLLGIPGEAWPTLRYQLFHRAAAAVFEAQAYGCSRALLLVHSFSAAQTGLDDFAGFCAAMGVGSPEPDRIVGPARVSGVDLYCGWVSDTPPRATTAPPTRSQERYGARDGRVGVDELRRLLITRARRGEPIAYGEVAAAFDTPWQQGFGSSLKRALNTLGAQNRAAGEPLLMALVVNVTSRLPGDGFFEQLGEKAPNLDRRREVLAREVERCRTWEWQDVTDMNG